MIENKVLEVAQNVLGTECKIVKRLLGGMSNYTYVVSYNDKLYTVRIPGENSEKFSNREEEKIGIDIFESLSLTTKTIYFDKTTGIKVSEYVDGDVLNTLDNIDYQEVSNLLHKVHNSNIQCDVDYDAFNRLNYYESHLDGNERFINNHYLEIKNKLFSYQEYLEKQPKVFCHNDCQPSNFILTKNELKIVDFEFVGNNDYLYDIACFGNNDFEEALKLLKVYEKNINDNIYKRLNLWRAFQCLQWYLVASFKDITGMSEKLKIDFKAVGEMYLDLALKHITISEKYN